MLLWISATVDTRAGEEVRFKRWFVSGEGYGEDNIGTIDSFAEDPKGFIWLGGEFGLGRFDGHRLKIYRNEPNNPNSLPRDFIRDITFDHDGTLWIATTAGLVFYAPSVDGFIPFPLNEVDGETVSADTSSLDVDQHNNLIVGTHIGMAIVSADRKHIRRFRNHPDDASSLSDDYIRKVLVDSHDHIWVGTTGGLNRMDPERKSFERFLHHKKDPQSLIDNDVTAIAEDHSGDIWVGTRANGVSRLDRTRGFRHYLHDSANPNSLGANAIQNMVVDRRGQVWLATDHGGLARYRARSNDFEVFRHDESSSTSLSSNIIRGLFEDSRGDLWVGTFPTGVNFHDTTTSIFTNFRHNLNDPNSLSSNAILTFFKDSSGTIWVGTEDGLNIFDKASGQFQRIYHNAKDPDALRFGAVLDIVEDRDGSLWMATWSGGLHRYDKKTKKFKNYFVDSSVPGSITSKFVWHLFIDKANDLWIGTEGGGLNRYIRETDSFESWRHDPKDKYSILDDDLWTMLEDSRGQFWIGGKNGLNRMDRKTGKFINFRGGSDDPSAINGQRIFSMIEGRDGRVWVATQDKGLFIYDAAEQNVVNLNVQNGLPSNELASLLEDHDSNIWVTTTQGIARVDHKTLAIQVFTKDHGLVGNHFNRDASFQDGDGIIYLGGTEGISAFHPRDLKREEPPPKIYFTDLQILNESVEFDPSHSVLDAPIMDAKQVILQPHDSLVTFEFALLSYRAPNRNRYRYRLIGFDRDWIVVKDTNRATYSNLSAGTYTFQVEGANRDGVWTLQPAQIKVVVLPTLWKTWWAFLIYAAIFFATVYYFWTAQIRRIELSKEKQLNSNLVKIDLLKDAILANTSHQLRTPLHSIIGLSESLCNGLAGELNSTAIDYLKVVIGNGRKLTNLVDDILEYSSLTRSLSALNIRPVDLRSAVDSAFDSVQHLKGKKPIQFVNDIAKDAPLVRADENRVAQILITLLERVLGDIGEGKILVTSHEKGNYLSARVTITGLTLTDAQLSSAFEPFDFSGDNASDGIAGAGLGLAICKHLVDIQGGEISISCIADEGTRITFSLPLEEAGDIKKGTRREFRAVPMTMLKADMNAKTHDFNDLMQVIGNPKEYTILVVDDDSVNRMVLVSMLYQSGFKTMEATTGVDALDLLAKKEVNIHLVIMDVMMPVLSGFETCERIREQYDYFELPVIFLTAKKLHQATLDGFFAGGNEFITKPVVKEELIPRVINQLRRAASLQGEK